MGGKIDLNLTKFTPDLLNYIKIAVNQNLLVLIISMIGLGFAEYFKLFFLGVISFFLCVINGIFVCYSMYYYTLNYKFKKIKLIDEIFGDEKNMSNKSIPAIVKFIGFILIIISLILIFIYKDGIITINNGIIFAVISFLISIGFALFAWGFSLSSDKKMQALAELNFVEKNSVIFGYLSGIEKSEDNNLKRIICDLKASFNVIHWVKDTNTKNNFIEAFINLSEKIKDILKKPINEDIRVYIEILIELLEKSKRFNHKIIELNNIIKELKEITKKEE